MPIHGQTQGNHGCDGGLMDSAFQYVKAVGKTGGFLDVETCYPYHARVPYSCLICLHLAFIVIGTLQVQIWVHLHVCLQVGKHFWLLIDGWWMIDDWWLSRTGSAIRSPTRAATAWLTWATWTSRSTTRRTSRPPSPPSAPSLSPSTPRINRSSSTS